MAGYLDPGYLSFYRCAITKQTRDVKSKMHLGIRDIVCMHARGFFSCEMGSDALTTHVLSHKEPIA